MDISPFLQFLGDWIIYFQFALGISGAFLIIKKFISPRIRDKEISEALLGFGNLLQKGAILEAIKISHLKKNQPFFRIALYLLEKNELNKKSLENLALYQLKKEEPILERNLFGLFLITVLSLLLGLLGTMITMINLLLPISVSGNYLATKQLSQALLEGLMNSCVGLLIAIPCYCFYLYFSSSVKKSLSLLYAASLDLIHIISNAEKDS